jgi:hypothetical protein
MAPQPFLFQLPFEANVNHLTIGNRQALTIANLRLVLQAAHQAATPPYSTSSGSVSLKSGNALSFSDKTNGTEPILEMLQIQFFRRRFQPRKNRHASAAAAPCPEHRKWKLCGLRREPREDSDRRA